MDQHETSYVYEFGGFRLDARRRVLSRADGASIALKPKVFDTLAYLVEHAGEPLDKADLIAAVWPNVVVEENNLNKAISVLRRALGETPDEHKFIVTEPGRGYRFVATVVRTEPQPAAAPPAVAPTVAGRPRAYGRAAAAAAVVAAVAALGVAAYFPRDAAPAARAVRFQVEAAKTLNPLNMALAPNGEQIAYVGESDSGTAIWIRPLDSLDARAVLGTEDVTETAYPFWSPDGAHLAYRSMTAIRRIEVAGGTASTIVDGVTLFRRGAWADDDTVLYGSAEVIYRVQASGGNAVAATTLDPSLGETCHSAPQFLPDGKHFLYKSTNVDWRKGAIYVGSLDAMEARVRLLEASRAIYVEPGFIVYAKEHALYARAFDAAELRFTAGAVQIADDVFYRDTIDTSAFDVAGDTLIYRPVAQERNPVPLLWVDGLDTATVAGRVLPATDFRLSPDGERIVYAEGQPPDVWTLDLTRGARTRVTSDPQVEHGALWSPDGTSVAFDAHRAGGHAIYSKRADGAGPERLLLSTGAHDVAVSDWSADGRVILFHKDRCVGCGNDVWVLPMTGDAEPYAYAATLFDEQNAVLSPDGRFIAYETSESGAYDVVVQSFANPADGKWAISTHGGVAPRWSRDGKALYYFDGEGAVIRVDVETDPAFRVGAAVRVSDASGAHQWDVAPDGKRLLKVSGAAVSQDWSAAAASFPINVILNWTSLLEN